MRQATVYIYAAILAALATPPAMALTDLERMQQVEEARARNLETCMTGRSPESCKKHLLRPGEVKEAERAEHRENLRICLTGTNKAKCKKSLLSKSEREEVLEAEKAAAPAVKAPTPTPAPPTAPAVAAPAPPAAKTPAPAPTPPAAAAPVQPAGKAPAPPVVTAPPPPAPPASKAPVQPAGKTPAPAGRKFPAIGCVPGYLIESVSDNRQLITLGDGSVWKITPGKGVNIAKWLQGTNIVACDDKLINTDEKETVPAERIR